MPIYSLGDLSPLIHPDAFIAPSADLIGQVQVAQAASVWFGAVLRADTEAVTVGPGSNVQDGAVLHADPGFPCVLDSGVTVGHRAIVHGAHCAAGSLVGMGAVMLNGSRLGAGAVLGAGGVLPEGAEVPAGMLALGIPARVVRPVSPTAPEVSPSAGSPPPTDLPPHAQRYVERAEQFRRMLAPAPSGSTPPDPSTSDVSQLTRSEAQT